jgi:sugar O-acyltransferase (sialic acid O-acetyltransferase NeuD family)
MSRKIVLVGAFHEMVELCEACNVEIAGIFDEHVKGDFMGHKILGREEDARRLADLLREVPVLIVPDAPEVRRRLAGYYLSLGYRPASLVSPKAVVSKSASIGPGTIVQNCCHISTSVRIGEFVKVNAAANIMHDSVVGDFTTVAPNAVMLGRVSVGAGCYVGANATLLPDIEIGEEAIVGAGAVVTRDVAPGAVVMGNPAQAKGKS